MKIIDQGHDYQLLDGQTLTFMKREDGQIVTEGTTNEEVIQVLIDRLHFLDSFLPCVENSQALMHLHGALGALRMRTRLRVKGGVEGTDNPHDELPDDDEMEEVDESPDFMEIDGVIIEDEDDDL